MAGALYIPGADRTSRWFYDDFPNAAMPRIDKTLLHSTETPKTSGCPGYQSGAVAPQVTINPWAGYRKIWQHFPINRPGRALGNPSSTPVSENKDNVFQVEIIGYSDPDNGRRYGCYLPEMTSGDLDYLAEMLAFVHEEWPHSTGLPSTWPLYKVSSWPAMDAAHMSSSRYDAFEGILAHLHAPLPSTHGDVALRIQTLKAKIDTLLTGGPVAIDPGVPNYVGDTASINALKAFMRSDVFPHPDRAGNPANPYVTGYQWHQIVGASLTALEDKVDTLTKAMTALATAVQASTPKDV